MSSSHRWWSGGSDKLSQHASVRFKLYQCLAPSRRGLSLTYGVSVQSRCWRESSHGLLQFGYKPVPSDGWRVDTAQGNNCIKSVGLYIKSWQFTVSTLRLSCSFYTPSLCFIHRLIAKSIWNSSVFRLNLSAKVLQIDVKMWRLWSDRTSVPLFKLCSRS